MEIIIAIAVVIIGVLLVAVLMFNTLVSRQNAVDKAFASIDAFLKKRHDLIPEVVESTARYMVHERDLMENLTKWRARADSLPLGSPDRNSLERNIGSDLRALIATAENYPMLKASENFLYLQNMLNEVEDQIAAARRFYNSSVTDYNNAVQMFPWSMIASIGAFGARDWFKATDDERKKVSVRECFQNRS